MAWRPLLTGQRAQVAQQAVLELAEALLALPSDRFQTPLELADAALFCSYAGASLSQPRLTDDAIDLLALAASGVADAHLSPALFEGFLGVAWVVEHLSGTFMQLEPGVDPNGEVDAELAALLERRPWRGDFDLIRGLVGIGVYLIERLPQQDIRPQLVALLDCLDDLRRPTDGGLAWATVEQAADGTYDLGVAHGVPGVVGFLAMLCDPALSLPPQIVARAAAALELTVQWLLTRGFERGGFPYRLGPEADREPGRLSWCYGDAGISITLLAAARHLRRRDWERAALRIGIAAAERGIKESRVVDPGICHGAAGVAHLFNRLYQATRDARFHRAAVRWYDSLFAYRSPDRGIAGFAALGSKGWKAAPDFLIGAAGVGLVLLAATSETVPDWDRRLLAAVPPGTEPTADVSGGR